MAFYKANRVVRVEMCGWWLYCFVVCIIHTYVFIWQNESNKFLKSQTLEQRPIVYYEIRFCTHICTWNGFTPHINERWWNRSNYSDRLGNDLWAIPFWLETTLDRHLIYMFRKLRTISFLVCRFVSKTSFRIWLRLCFVPSCRRCFLLKYYHLIKHKKHWFREIKLLVFVV